MVLGDCSFVRFPANLLACCWVNNYQLTYSIYWFFIVLLKSNAQNKGRWVFSYHTRDSKRLRDCSNSPITKTCTWRRVRLCVCVCVRERERALRSWISPILLFFVSKTTKFEKIGSQTIIAVIKSFTDDLICTYYSTQW